LPIPSTSDFVGSPSASPLSPSPSPSLPSMTPVSVPSPAAFNPISEADSNISLLSLSDPEEPVYRSLTFSAPSRSSHWDSSRVFKRSTNSSILHPVDKSHSRRKTREVSKTFVQANHISYASPMKIWSRELEESEIEELCLTREKPLSRRRKSTPHDKTSVSKSRASRHDQRGIIHIGPHSDHQRRGEGKEIEILAEMDYEEKMGNYLATQRSRKSRSNLSSYTFSSSKVPMRRTHEPNPKVTSLSPSTLPSVSRRSPCDL